MLAGSYSFPSLLFSPVGHLPFRLKVHKTFIDVGRPEWPQLTDRAMARVVSCRLVTAEGSVWFPVHVTFLVHRAALRKALLRVLKFSTVVVIPLVLHPRPLLLPSLCSLSNCRCPETLKQTWLSDVALEMFQPLCVTQPVSIRHYTVTQAYSSQLAFCLVKKNLQCKLLLLPVGTRCHPAQDAPQNAVTNYYCCQ